MPEGQKIGSAYIEITPEVNRQAAKKTVKELKDHLQKMGGAVSREWKAQNDDLMGGFRKQVMLARSGQTEGVFKAFKQDTQAFQALDKQRKAAFASEAKDQQRRLADLSKWHDQKVSKERAAAAESLKVSRSAASEMDKVFRDTVMKSIGATAKGSGGSAVDRLGFNRIPAAAAAARSSAGRSIDGISHSLSQLSTRIGIASFQMQMLGGMMSTFVTAPVAMGFGQLARDGLQFAVNIDYARASMKALLPVGTDVEKILNDIKQIAIDSPMFAADDAIHYAQQIAAVGVQSKDLVSTIRAMSNIFLTQGVAGPERAKLAMLAYTQILSKGKIGMDDLRQQFAEHVPGGIKVFEKVAKNLGYKSIPDLNDAFKSGKVTMVELNNEFIKLGNSEQYLEGATNAASTLGGVWQALREEMNTKVGTAFDANRKQIIEAINAIRPTIMQFIDWFVARIPDMINKAKEFADKIELWRQKFNSLSPDMQNIIKNVALFTLVIGPAAVALGVLGTALSAVANTASLLMKAMAFMAGGGAAGAVGAVTVATAGIAAAVLAIGALMAYLYQVSEPFRKLFLQILNQMKDFLVAVLLPVIDDLWEAMVQLGRMFGEFGLKSEHLAYLMYLLAIPIASLVVVAWLLYAVVVGLKWVVFVLAAAFDGLMHTMAGTAAVFQKMYELMGEVLPGKMGESARETAAKVQKMRDEMTGIVETGDLYKKMGSEAGGATDGLKNSLGNADFAADGLNGTFQRLMGGVSGLTSKEITLEEAINNARAAMQGQKSTMASLTDASDSYQKSLLGLKESVKTNGYTLSEFTKKGQANRDMFKQSVQASYELMLQDIKSGVPMEQAIKRHKDRVAALKGEVAKTKETKKEADLLIGTYGKIPKDVKSLLELMGYKDVKAKMMEILATQSLASNPGSTYSKELRDVNKQFAMEKRYGGLKGDGFAVGGRVRGPGGPTADKIHARLSDDEYVVKTRSAKRIGYENLDYINTYGQLPPQYAGGGRVQRQNWPTKVDVSKTKFPEYFGGGGSGMGWAQQWAWVKSRFPYAGLSSGYRPGDPLYHGKGRAIDITTPDVNSGGPKAMAIFNAIKGTFMGSIKELIYDFAGSNAVWNGRNHFFTGSGAGPGTHSDHIHWAHDNGGYIKPNTPYINKTGANELALNAAQGRALEDRIRGDKVPCVHHIYFDGELVDDRIEVVTEQKNNELIRTLGGA